MSEYISILLHLFILCLPLFGIHPWHECALFHFYGWWPYSLNLVMQLKPCQIIWYR